MKLRNIAYVKLAVSPQTGNGIRCVYYASVQALKGRPRGLARDTDGIKHHLQEDAEADRQHLTLP
jgi:hypothetical protein